MRYPGSAVHQPAQGTEHDGAQMDIPGVGPSERICVSLLTGSRGAQPTLLMLRGLSTAAVLHDATGPSSFMQDSSRAYPWPGTCAHGVRSTCAMGMLLAQERSTQYNVPDDSSTSGWWMCH